MDPKCCAGVKGEQLFSLEMFVESINLFVEKIDPTHLGVDIKFIDFPLFRIFQSGFSLTRPERHKSATRDTGQWFINFNAGKMYLFAMNSGELVEKMRSMPLLLDIYAIKEVLLCPEGVSKRPLAEAKILIPGCLCDQVMMSSNDALHLPKPYLIKNTFGLLDLDRKPVGYISLLLRLTCFGKHMINRFSIVGKKLLFRNVGSFNEFLLTKARYRDEKERRAAERGRKICQPEEIFEKNEMNCPPEPRNVAGFVLVCKELSALDGYPPEVVPPNYPIQIPEKESKPITRKNFEEAAESEGPPPYTDRFFLHQAGCVHVGCTGNICTGKK